MQAKAIDVAQQAISHEATRTQELLDGGFVSPNEAEQKTRRAPSEEAELAPQKANLSKSALEVSDCVLRAPFDGEVATGLVDPGAFVRPGTEIDRSSIGHRPNDRGRPGERLRRRRARARRSRCTSSRPTSTIRRRSRAARRAPTRDAHVHFEIDIPDSEATRSPWTRPARSASRRRARARDAVPLSAVTINDKKATLFVVDGDVAHARRSSSWARSGERLLLARRPQAGDARRRRGRALLKDGDRSRESRRADRPSRAARRRRPVERSRHDRARAPQPDRRS
jgi:multidrug efflux pump subunit AcrA (membrane-fusion protein)